MGDKRNQARPRRVFPSWIRALYHAVMWSTQTRWKWRVRRIRPNAFVIERTDRPWNGEGPHGREWLERYDRLKPRA